MKYTNTCIEEWDEGGGKSGVRRIKVGIIGYYIHDNERRH